jgi:acetylornithine deacetylase/succinyl-diaminopimelate desuccinylase-like protein
MHQIDECVPLAEVDSLARIYEAVLDAYFPA